ncbi:MAG: protein kinase, partial [Myxococcales bacterium]|nr:protein kinase [Myxococcales bacterium]
MVAHAGDICALKKSICPSILLFSNVTPRVMTEVKSLPRIVRLPSARAAMTNDDDPQDTSGDAWEGTENLDDEEREELERLQAKFGFREAAPARVIDQRYEVLGILGNGGMGMVYRVRDRRIDRVVALKLVRYRPFRDDERLQERLQREATALGQFDDHDNVVSVIEVSRDGERLYFTMPYIEGENLYDWQARGGHAAD